MDLKGRHRLAGMGREEPSGKPKAEHASRVLGALGGGQRLMGAGPQDLRWEVARNDLEGGTEGLWATWWVAPLRAFLQASVSPERCRKLGRFNKRSHCSQ